MAADWIEWNGGCCPVGKYERVEVRLRDESETTRECAVTFDWRHVPTDAGQDIIAYRVVSR